jgi:hypothetical protein
MIIHGKGNEEYCVDIVEDKLDINLFEESRELREVPKEYIPNVWGTTIIKDIYPREPLKFNLPDAGYPRGFKYYPMIFGDDGKLYKDPNDKSTLL